VSSAGTACSTACSPTSAASAKHAPPTAHAHAEGRCEAVAARDRYRLAGDHHLSP
jgi:hypothetical protein